MVHNKSKMGLVVIMGGDSGKSTVPYQGGRTRDPLEFIINDQESSEAGEASASIHSRMGQEFQRDQC